MVREVFPLQTLQFLSQEIRLPLKNGKARQNEMPGLGVCTGFVQIYDIHNTKRPTGQSVHRAS